MKDNLFIASLVAMAGLSVILYHKNRNLAAQYQEGLSQANTRLEKAIASTEDLWMRSAEFGNVIGDCRMHLFNKGVGVLIVFNEKSGCGSCLQLEATDWQEFLNQDAMAEKVALRLICTVRNEARRRQEFKSMHISFPICYDSTGALLKDLDIQWTPRVFFLYKGKIVGGYTAEMHNREKSRAMMAKFKAFVNLY